MHIKASLNLRDFFASSTVCTSIIIDILRFNASWYNSSANLSDTPAKIIKKKKEKIESLKETISLESLKELISSNKTFINFKEKIEKNIKNNKISIIAEIKKASPSAGILIKDYDPVKIANIYNENKATCLSVLTEEDFFLGKIEHISEIKQKINLPILCKDFLLINFKYLLLKAMVLMLY